MKRRRGKATSGYGADGPWLKGVATVSTSTDVVGWPPTLGYPEAGLQSLEIQGASLRLRKTQEGDVSGRFILKGTLWPIFVFVVFPCTLQFSRNPG